MKIKSRVYRLLVSVIKNNVFPVIKVEKKFRNVFTNQIAPIKGWLTLDESFLLFKCASAILEFEKVIEVGSYEGRSTVSICKGLESTEESTLERVFSVDPHSGDITEVQVGLQIDTWASFNENLRKFGCDSIVKSFRMTSDEASKLIQNEKIGLLFIDGWHTYDAVANDFKNYLPKITSSAIVLIDDWRQPEILEAILDNIRDLPELIGFVGKVLVFSNSSEFTKSKIGRTLRRHLSATIRLSFIATDEEAEKIVAATNWKP